jgi:hypothetical protein
MAKFRPRHPASKEKVRGRFIVVQGDGDKAVTKLVGIIKGGGKTYTGKQVDSKIPGHWLIAFTKIPAGKNYSFELSDAKGGLLASISPFEVIDGKPVAPPIFYPAMGGTVGQNFSTYGTSTATDVSGQVTGPGTPPTVNGTETQRPTNWIVSFSGIPLDNTGMTTLTVTDQGAAMGNQVKTLKVQ